MKYESIVFFSFLILLLQCIFYLYKSRGHISKSFFMFQVIFMCFAPALQLYYSKVPWDFAQASLVTFLSTNLLLLCSNLIFFNLANRNKHEYSSKLKDLYLSLKGEKVEGHIRFKYPSRLIILSLSALALWTYVYGVHSLNQLLYRNPGEDYTNIILTGPASLLFETVRYIPFFSFVVYRLHYEKKVHLNLFFFLLIVYLFPPMAIARFNLGVIYLTLFIVFFPSILKGMRIHFLLFLGFFSLFPLSDMYRMRDQGQAFNFSNFFNYKILLSENFDTYSSLLLVIEQNIVTYGYQLLGVIFFFIPRSMWPGKPIGSGAFIAELNNRDFTNISLNFFGEGFINLGYTGILLFALFLGLIVSYLEKIDLVNITSRRNFSIFSSLYLIMIPYIFFILRGDFLSSFSYLISMIVAIMITVFSDIKFVKNVN